jgi:hypothetical protein
MCDLCDALVKKSIERRKELSSDEVRCGAVVGYYRCNAALKPLIEICNQKGMSVSDMPMVETIIDFMVNSLLQECECGDGNTLLHHFADELIFAVKKYKLGTN